MMISKTNPVSPARFGRAQRPTSLIEHVFTLLAIHRERHSLRNLNSHLLKDIGVTQNEAEKEANRAAWDAPSRWMR